MELIKELQKQKEAKSSENDRLLYSIKAGKYSMSVQGSRMHYCTPRETLPVEDYKEMELALFNKRGWLHINRSMVIKAFPRYIELLERAEDINSSAPFFAYVPIDLLQSLYMYLKGV